MAAAHTALVSVLMPVRDEEEAIGGALESVLEQSWPHVEVLVVDGLSRDRTREIVTAYAERDARVRLLHNPRQIIPAGLNVGLAHARGDYVMRVDGHWTINRTYIQAGLDVLASSSDVAAVGGRRNAVAVTSVGTAIACALSSKFGVGNSIYHHGTQQQETDHASGGIYRAEVARAVGGWDESLPVNEDVDFDHRIRELGHRIIFEPSMVSHWRGRESLRDFGRQYRRYGRGKARMLRKNGIAAVRARHLAAPAVVLALTASVLAAGAGRRGIALLLGAPYPLAVGAATIVVRGQQPSPRPGPLTLAGAFATMHLSWGFGVLEGLLWAAPPAAASARQSDAAQ